ncbi:MAG: T9SS type A sorting domain-containing protein [Saprospiraceae bacterium]
MNTFPLSVKTGMLSFCLVLFHMTGWSQSTTFAKPQVLSSGGQHFATANTHLDYTLGEFMVQTLDGIFRLSQGFHQPGLEAITEVVNPFFDGKIDIYPNPTSGLLRINLHVDGKFEMNIYDLQGRQMMQEVFSITTLLHLDQLYPGPYLLNITHHGYRVSASLINKM